jgi:hypothetical protein
MLTENEIFDIMDFGVPTAPPSLDNLKEEGATSGSYTIVLLPFPPQDGNDVVIDVIPDAQVTVDPVQFTITNANWTPFVLVSVTVEDDNIPETTPHIGTITHTITTTDPNYAADLIIPNVEAQITDNDLEAVFVDESSNSTDVVEAGATDGYTVVLGAPPTDDVVIDIATDGQTTVDPVQLTFLDAGSAPNDWKTPKLVIVTAENDVISEGPHNSTISHTVTSVSDLDYNGLAAPNVVANVADNEPYCGDGTHGFWAADLDCDCKVGLSDFALFSGQWMNCSDPFDLINCISSPPAGCN